ncbi:hypothetical protein [Secundilactobacillus similis]|uniref:hypothetical protein n=1 Tax=Secundilactobacillus similis TaxID=414682 RepID=UPI0006D25314|nr:hypothetical protein [Secundilactobacillus similis]
MVIVYFFLFRPDAVGGIDRSTFDGAKVVRIEPINAYPNSYNELVDESRQEAEEHVAHEVQPTNFDFSKKQTIFVRFPSISPTATIH